MSDSCHRFSHGFGNVEVAVASQPMGGANGVFPHGGGLRQPADGSGVLVVARRVRAVCRFNGKALEYSGKVTEWAPVAIGYQA